MKLSDLSTGPDWVAWIVFFIAVILSIVFCLGRGSGLIAGYNTSSKKEKEKYDEKKLCRIMGIGMAVISAVILVMLLFDEALPASAAYICAGIIAADCLIMVILGNTIGRKSGM